MINTQNTYRNTKWKYVAIVVMSVLAFIFYGCGKEIEKNPVTPGAPVGDYSLVTIKGRVVAPLAGELQNSRSSFSLSSVQGTLVFVEDSPNLFAYADANGDFLIEGVPHGMHAIIAEKNEGYVVFKQRQDNVEITGKESVQSLTFPIPLEEAGYSLVLHFSDINNDKPVDGIVSLWGRSFSTFDGGVSITPFPEGTSRKEAKITSIGYLEQTIKLDFGKTKNSQMYIKLTPTTGDTNKAPVVAIEQSEEIAYTDSQIRFTALGYDPEGETPVWNWTSTSGSFVTANTNTVVYNTPSNAGHTVITLTGKDSKGASGQAVLNLDILTRGSRPSGNRPPSAPTNPNPSNGGEHIDKPIAFSWNCSDPDGDSISYSLLMGTSGTDLTEIASGLTTPHYSYSTIAANTTYYWKIVAYDENGASATSSLWRFKTGDLINHAPNEPSEPSPTNHQADVDETSLVFAWSGGDIDGDSVMYYIFLATFDEGVAGLKQVGSSQKPTYKPVALKKDISYFWRVKAVDSFGKETNGPVWQFSTTTTSGNRMPSAAAPREPLDKDTMVSTTQKLVWSASDPDLDVLYYDVYFGKSENPPLVSSNQTIYIYNPGELEENTTYYWRVVVSDGKLTNPESTVWSFTTSDSTGGDAPSVILVSPPVNSEGEFKLEFNTAMNKNSINTDFKFSPSVRGSWTWNEAGTIVSFKPASGSWQKGSYNKFILNPGSIASKVGIKITQKLERTFTIPSSVKVPSGYRSMAFPYELAANQTYEITLPADIPDGKSLYLLTVAGGDNNNFIVKPPTRASISGNGHNDPTYGLRLQELEMMKNKLPDIVLNGTGNSVARAAESDPAIGSIKKIYVSSIATATSYPDNRLDVKLVKKSGNTLVYADKSIEDPNLDSFASSLMTKFDNSIYNKVKSTFGDEPELGPDGNSRMKIIIIKPGEGFTLLGYFNAVDLYVNDPLLSSKDSNEGKILYMMYTGDAEKSYGTLAHEFQHMINYYQKNKTLAPSVSFVNEEIWLNEGLSQYAKEVCGFDIDAGKDSVLTNQVRLTLDNQKKLSVTTWDDTESLTYGYVYLLIKFLTDAGRYSNDNAYIASSLVSGGGRGLTGEANIENVTNEPFSETMAKFGLSLYLNRYTSTDPQDYGIKKLNLKGTYNGVTFAGFEIEKVTNDEITVTDQMRNAFRCFKITSEGTGNKTVKVINGNQPITLWLFDERP